MHLKVFPMGIRVTGMTVALVCAMVVSSCSSASETSSGASMRHTIVSRPIPGVRVGLTPTLDGGYAGWCISTTRAYLSRKGHGGGGDVGGCTGARPSTGPIFVETCGGVDTPKALVSTRIVVLTKGDVAAVTVAGGGTPIPTESNSTLPGGLRAAAIELPGYRIVPKSFSVGYPWHPCPRVTPLDASGKPIGRQGRSGIPLSIRLPRRSWYPPARPPRGICQITATRLPRETVPIEGTVVTRLRPFPELFGHAFIACTDTVYFYQDNHDLPAAVLLDAANPGATPPGLPGMKPLAGHPSVFTAPPDRFARRIHGAWLVVQEEDHIGPSVPLELLGHLHAIVHL
jgi:hypothetical protein